MTYEKSLDWASLPEPAPVARPIVMAHPVKGLPRARANRLIREYTKVYGGPPVLCLGLYPGKNDISYLAELYPHSWSILWDSVEVENDFPMVFHILSDSEVIWLFEADVRWYSTRKRMGLRDMGNMAFSVTFRKDAEIDRELLDKEVKHQYPQSYPLMTNEDYIPIPHEGALSYLTTTDDMELADFLGEHPMPIEGNEFWAFRDGHKHISEIRGEKPINTREIRQELMMPSKRGKYWEIWLSPCPNRLILYYEHKQVWQEGVVCICYGKGAAPTQKDLYNAYRKAIIGSWYYAMFGEPMFQVKTQKGRVPMTFLPPEVYSR